ncbi:MAG: von Willebrand factor type A domain-containing protein [Pseudomonadota bacterium]
MTDHDDLKQLLADAQPPHPAPDARARAKEAALAAFDAEAEKTSTVHQGTSDPVRQRVRQSGLMSKVRSYLMNMTLPSTRTMMLGGSSLAVFVIAIMAVQTMDLNDGFAPSPVISSPEPPQEARQDARSGDQATASGSATPQIQPMAQGQLAESAEEQLAAQPQGSPLPQLSEQAASADQSQNSEGGLRLSEPEAPADAAPSPVAKVPAGAAASGPRVSNKPLAPAARTPQVYLGNRTSTERQRAGLRERTERMNDQIRALNRELQRLQGTNPPAEQDAAGLSRRQESEVLQDTDRSQAIKRKIKELEEEWDLLDEEAPADGFVDQRQQPDVDTGRDQFGEFVPNPVVVTSESPVSTFSVDVDTASYAFMRNALMQGVLPQKNAVRIEELVNYFPYDYARPESRDVPFTSDVTVMPTPWNDGTKLMRIGIQGYELAPEEKPRSNLVFLLDTSGSMNNPDKLPLLIQSFELMVDNLDDDDTVSIVVYAGSAGTVLPPTKVKNRDDILAALNRLRAGGSTAGGEGIRQAYKMAEQNFDKNGINRVILATDGDFNVGIRDTEELKSFIEHKRDTGVFLSVLGFGQGNYNDALMQTLAQNGNGNAAYIDTIQEARKVLVEEASSTLFPIAKDVKIQVEFNPATVGEYRLIGFETRILNREDFNNDKIDAGEIGAGHSVTALYEITPVDSDARLMDTSRYEAEATATTEQPFADEYAFVKIRYKQPDADESQLITQPVTTASDVEPGVEARFAAAVAAFGQLLRGGRHTGEYSYDDVVALAKGALGDDPFGYRAEFVDLARRAAIADALEQQ